MNISLKMKAIIHNLISRYCKVELRPTQKLQDSIREIQVLLNHFLLSHCYRMFLVTLKIPNHGHIRVASASNKILSEHKFIGGQFLPLRSVL